MPSGHIDELKNLARELARKAEPCDAELMARAASLIAKNFAVQPHEVAILGLATDERFLLFVVPEALREVGTIPLSSTTSLAARTVREQRAEIANNFSSTPHAFVFEGVPLPPELLRGDPIQKIMSVPIVLDGKAIGVIQVSRKGTTPAEAGPDFAHQELRELKIVADALAPCIALCHKE
jgi:GAF domain-containing protein